MKLAAATIIAALACTACALAESTPPVPVKTGIGFSLRAGEFAQASDADLRVGFERVTVDSRCPKGDQCFWAGDAAVLVWLQRSVGPRETRELHTGLGAARTVSALGYDLSLVQLNPYPAAGKTISDREYVATLLLSRTSTAGSDR